MDKREIRRTMRAARRAVPAADKARHDAQISAALLARPDVSAAIASHAPISLSLSLTTAFHAVTTACRITSSLTFSAWQVPPFLCSLFLQTHVC